MSIGRAVGIWAGQVRAPFLLLSVVLAAIAGAAAHRDGAFHCLRFSLAAAGVVLAHVGVNLLNELSDHRTGIDERTARTPFSGGSGLLQAGLTTPRAVLAAAAGALLVALCIGVYLAWAAGWEVLAFAAAGGLAAVFYTSHLTRWGLGEIVAGLCLGTFPVLGTYWAQASALPSHVIWVSIPPGILTALLLLLNEIPDAEADRAGGRRHLVILLGRRGAASLYAIALAACYAVIVAGAAIGTLPGAVILGCLTLPLAVRAAVGAFRDAEDVPRLVPAMAANVGVVIGTDLLIAVGYLVA